ncbi:hypothetical protein IGS59_21795 [Janthinobacterium sp. GW460P]|uniref:hypothetical protein n=1 Tax=unclassified Janthinobacterium TaxID=2610881 RepID=UPI00111BEFEC|nr:MULTISPECIES: hypothetical protein [unclassified Janthinobacterium]MCC7704880.1 hypothetical protein [Janthinobacterium sp. GW460P]MCC7710505.1 hypothetical protein [Janthinobacterium sp. GW460W]
MGSIPASRTRQIKTPVLSSQHCHAAACRIPHRDSSTSACAGSAALPLARAATFFSILVPKLPLTPLPLSLYTRPSARAADIEIDIETVENLIGEIIAQPLR